MFKIEKVSDSSSLGEGPHWDSETQSLYYVDIIGKSVHKYKPATKEHSEAVIGENYVSFIIPIKGALNKFLIALGNELAVISWNGTEQIQDIKKIAKLDSNSSNRINDGKADPSGRLWTGTMHIEENNKFVPQQGSLYSYEKGNIKTHMDKISISNGLAWNKALDKFYYIDSHVGSVDEYDFDITTGTIKNRKPIFTLAKHNIMGLPDGQTIDTDGNLWVAVFNGGCVIKIDPRKPETLLETIVLPAKQPTSVAFGGPNLDELYVTSAQIPMNDIDLDPTTDGVLYKITGTGSKGFPGDYVQI